MVLIHLITLLFQLSASIELFCTCSPLQACLQHRDFKTPYISNFAKKLTDATCSVLQIFDNNLLLLCKPQMVNEDWVEHVWL
jgi:hypothetical protein